MDAVFSGEFFEISFIYNGTQVEDLYNFFSLHEGKNSSNNSEIPFLRNKSIHAQHYVKDDYTVVIFNITDLVISSACFLEVLINIADMANRAFSAFPQKLEYITCIYELTFDLIGHINKLSQYNTAVLSRFPIVFSKKNSECSTESTFEFDKIRCKVNGIKIDFRADNTTQNIFSDV